MSQIKSHIEDLDAAGNSAVVDLAGGMETAMALEAIASYLSKSMSTETLTPVNVNLANLAIESICSKVKIKPSALAFSMENYEENPQAVLDGGIASIQEKIDSIWEVIEASMAKLLGVVSEKITGFKTKLTSLEKAIAELETLVSTKDSRALSKVSHLESTFTALGYTSKGFPPCGAGICAAVDNLLTVHATAFKKAIGVQVCWLKDNQANLLANQNIFKSLKFGGSELLILNSTDLEQSEKGMTRELDQTPVFCSEELPGGMYLFSQLPAGDTEGEEAIEAMSKVELHLHPAEKSKEVLSVNVLTINEAKTKLAELKNSVTKLKEWYEVIYRDIWKDQAFEVMLSQSLCRQENSNAGSRELKNFILVILSLMQKATQEIDDYAFATYGAMAEYVGLSLAQYD